MALELFFQEIVGQLALGELAAPPQRVSGGFLHKMYKLQTTTGAYALKLLNPEIMRRDEVMGNYQRAERLERILEENDIPVITALEKNGKKMQCLDGQYYYLFGWSEGKALGWHEIEVKHCRVAGRLLAGIHRIPCGEATETSGQENGKGTEGDPRQVSKQENGKGAEGDPRQVSRQENGNGEEESSRRISGQEIGKEEKAEALHQEGLFDIDWDSYVKQAAAACPEIAGALAENRELFYLAQREYNAAVRNASEVRCICDGDMDCKNVLWIDDKPYIIDLECLDYGNPFTEMFQLALSWAGGAVCELDMERFAGFVDAYRCEYGECGKAPVDWMALSGVGYSWLDWLAYNVRRALGIECGDEEERQLGIREARETIRRIQYYYSVRAKLNEYFETM